MDRESTVGGTPKNGQVKPLLSVNRMRKYFPIKGGLLNRHVAAVKAVDDVSFDVRPGEVLGIVGESGCGKSTTARLVMRLIEPDAGRVVFQGREVSERGGMTVTELRRQVQMVFQDSYSSLNPRLPVEDTIAFGPMVHGAPKHSAKKRARELLNLVGLEPNRFRSPLSARTFRRSAPAREYRPRPCPTAADGFSRRSRVRTRQIRRGTGSQFTAGPACGI